MDFRPSTIRESGRVKKIAKEQDITLGGGRNSKIFESIEPVLDNAINESIERNREWVESELQNLSQGLEESGVPLEQLVNEFRETLKKRIKMIIRLNKKTDATFIDEGMFNNIFNQAVFDFIVSLRRSADRKDTLTQALAFAGLTHWLEPGEIDRLSNKYKDSVDQNVIKFAAVSYARDPDKFLDSYVQKVEDLTKRYSKDVDPSVISKLAVYKDPDEHIGRYFQRIGELVKRYKEVDMGAIKVFALSYPKNPEKAIDNYIKEVERLKGKFSHIQDPSMISYAVLNIPGDPDSFIEWYINSKKYLLSKGYAPNMITRALQSHHFSKDLDSIVK